MSHRTSILDVARDRAIMAAPPTPRSLSPLLEDDVMEDLEAMLFDPVDTVLPRHHPLLGYGHLLNPSPTPHGISNVSYHVCCRTYLNLTVESVYNLSNMSQIYLSESD